MQPSAPEHERIDSVLLHDLKNLVGIVHAAAVDLRQGHAAGESIREGLAELVSLSGLIGEALRGLTSEGRSLPSFDLRAAVLCARMQQRNLSVGELLRPVRVDANAGALTDLVVAIGAALGGEGGLVFVREDDRPGLLFEPSVPGVEVSQAVAHVVGPYATSLGCVLRAEGGSVRLAVAR
jgi:hypothetical protein